MTKSAPDPAATAKRESVGVLDLQPEHLQQTRVQISALVAEIATATKQSLKQEAFLKLTLDRLVEAMGAQAAAIWTQDDAGLWTPIASKDLPLELLDQRDVSLHGLDSTDPNDVATLQSIEAKLDRASWIATASFHDSANEQSSATIQASTSHALILNRVMTDGVPVLVPPRSIISSGQRPPNPIEFCLVFAPVKAPDSDAKLWLQAIQKPAGGPATQRGYLRFVLQIAELVEDYLQRERLGQLERERLRFELANQLAQDLDRISRNSLDENQFDRAKRVALQSESIYAEAFGRWVNADEAFLVVKRSSTSRLYLGSRMNGLRIVESSQAVVTWSQSLQQTIKQSPNCQPSIFDQVKNDPFYQQSRHTFGADRVAWIPLASDNLGSKTRQYVGLVLLWYSETSESYPKDLLTRLQNITAVAALSAKWLPSPPVQQLLSNLHLRPVGLQRVRNLVRSRSMRLAVLLIGLVVACCIPVPMQLSARGKLLPQTREAIYAPTDGIVKEVLVQYGQHVHVGQRLLNLQSVSLENEFETLLAQQIEKRQRQQDVELQLLRSKDLTPQQRVAYEGELQTIDVVLKSVALRIEMLRSQINALEVCANIDGVVGTWKAESVLINRPVQFGQPLLLIYNPESNWDIELQIEEQNLSMLRQAIKQGNLLLTCRLDSHPLQPIKVDFQLSDQAMVLHSNESGKSVVPIRISIDPKSLPHLTPGATVSAQLPVDRQPIAWVLTRDFILTIWTKVRLWI